MPILDIACWLKLCNSAHPADGACGELSQAECLRVILGIIVSVISV